MIYRGYINEVSLSCTRLGLYAVKRLNLSLEEGDPHTSTWALTQGGHILLVSQQATMRTFHISGDDRRHQHKSPANLVDPRRKPKVDQQLLR
jgi:hypothetical protein